MSLVNYRPSESPVAQMSVVAGLVASTAQALSLSFQEKSVLLRICQSFGSSVTYDVYRSVDGVVDSEPMVSGVSDAFYLSVVLGQENSILVLSLRAAGYYPILLTVSYLYEKDLLFISQVGVTGDMKYKMFNSTELSRNLDYTIDLFTAVPDLSIDTLPKVIDFLSGFVTTDNLKQYIADQVDAFEIVQGPGNSTTAVMSQNAVTEELRKKASMESVTASISAHNTSTTAHADIRELLNTCVGLPAYDSSSYKITFTTLAGATVEIDLPIEQLALRYNAETDSIEFDNADGTTTSIPVSAFVKEYVGSIGDRIQVSIDENNVIHATILKNSIDWDCLSFELQERINDHVTSADFATKAVRTDITQTLSIEAQNQALKNIGADLMIIDLVNGQATLTDEQEAALLSCKGVILRGTVNAGKEVLTKIYFSDYQGGDQVSFWAVRNNEYILQCVYTKSTKLFRFLTSAGFIDRNAVSIKKQTLSATEQAQALANLGMKVYVTDSSFLGSTLTAEEIEQLAVSKALLFTDTGDLFLLGGLDSYRITYTRATNNSTISIISITRSTNKVSVLINYNYIDSKAVHFTAHNPALTSAQQSQAFKNLGWKVHVISESAIGSSDAVSDDEKAARLSATTLLVQETGLLYNFSISSGGSRRFYGQFSNSFCTALNVNEATGVITSSFAYLYDPSAVSFDRDQSSVSDDNKNKALGNIGIDLVRLPYSLLNTTLSDEMMEVVDNARGIILVDTPSDYRNSTVFVKGNNVSGSCIFVAFVTGNTYSMFTLNKSTKLLSGISSGLTYGGSVRYAEEQSLTTAQQERALDNIGFPLVHLDFALIGTTLDDNIYNAVASAKGIILENVPDGNNAPSLYLVGNSDTVTTIFVSEFNARVWFVLTLSHTSKKLSLLSTGYATDVVRYSEGQNLTDTQKQQARANIGVKSADELLEDADFIAQLKTKLGIA